MQHQEWPQPLPPRHYGVAHRLLHPRLRAIGAGQDRVQGTIHQLGAGGNGLGQQADVRPRFHIV